MVGFFPSIGLSQIAETSAVVQLGGWGSGWGIGDFLVKFACTLSSTDMAKNVGLGPAYKEPAWYLIKVLFLQAEAEAKGEAVEFEDIKIQRVYWINNGKQKPQLKIENATKQTLSNLIKKWNEGITVPADKIGEILNQSLNGNPLEIYEDLRVQIRGPISKKLCFRLILWSTSFAENKKQFEQEWENAKLKKPNSPQATNVQGEDFVNHQSFNSELDNNSREGLNRSSLSSNFNSYIKRDLFLTGCTVGQRLSLVPLPGSGTLVILDEFLQAADRLGLSSTTSICKITNAQKKLVRSVEGDSSAPYITQFLDGMIEFTRDLRDNYSVEAFQWFYLGVLLFEIATFVVIDRTAALETHNATILCALADSIKLPARIRQDIVRFCYSAEHEEPNVLISDAQAIASVIYACI